MLMFLICRKIFVGGVSWDTKKGSKYFAQITSDFVCKALIRMTACSCICSIIIVHKEYIECCCSAEGLQAYFEKFGKVKDAVIMTDPITDKPRGFGFVTFEDPSIVDGVCSQEHILDAKKVSVQGAGAI